MLMQFIYCVNVCAQRGSMFYDLNVKLAVPSGPNNHLEGILRTLLEFGYRGVAITVDLDESVIEQKKEKSKNKNVSAPVDPVPPPPDIRRLREKFPKLEILRRVNVILSESENIRKILQSKNLKRYDLISCQPETQNVLKSLTSVGEFDIISYNPETKCSFSISRKLYKLFIAQNVFFELVYTPAITSSSARKNLIALSHIYHAVGKSKNIVVSSGTVTSGHLRGPYDVMNFNLLFGLSEEQAKKAITKNCEKLLLKARKQRHGKGVIEMTSGDANNQLEEVTSMDIVEE